MLFFGHLGFVELPDGKVLSGSEWGNMLLWDGGLIKVEICKKGNKLCHNGMIEQFFMDEGELMTIGADGFIKVCMINYCMSHNFSFRHEFMWIDHNEKDYAWMYIENALW